MDTFNYEEVYKKQISKNRFHQQQLNNKFRFLSWSWNFFVFFTQNPKGLW
jgi:hypothetical protein